MAEMDPGSKYAEEVIQERSLTMEDGRERGGQEVQQQTTVVIETPVRQGGDDGEGL